MQYTSENIVVRPSRSATDPNRLLSITPEEAGWDYISFQARHLETGDSWSFSSGTNEHALVSLTGQYTGKVLLGLIDVAEDQTLAQHLRVQGLPSIRVVSDGQITEQLDGPQPEEALRSLLDQLTLSPSDMLKEQLDVLIARGEYDTALGLLQQAVQEEPNNHGFRVELADILIIKGALDDARTVLAGIPEETEERERPVNRLAFAEEAADSADAAADTEALLAKLETDPGDLDSHYRLVVLSVVKGDYQTALDHAMSILQQDRTYRDDLGRTTMIQIFTLLGKGSDLATAYRRKMFNFMH